MGHEEGHCEQLGGAAGLNMFWQNPLHYPDRNGPCGLREEQCSMVELFLLKDSEQTHSGSAPISFI